MATAAEVLTRAATQIGYTESPRGSNRQKYSEDAGFPQGVPWCAIFQIWLFRKSEMRLPVESAYTPAMADGFRATGRWSRDPHVGDLAFFDFPDSTTRIQHVGLVESFDALSVTTIDGNTSAPSSGGSEDNGGGVFRRTRSRRFVVGYGRPEYSSPEDVMTPDQQRHIDEQFDELREEIKVVRTKVETNYNQINRKTGSVYNALMAVQGRVLRALGKPVAKADVDVDELAESIVEAGIGKAVADELAKRLKS